MCDPAKDPVSSGGQQPASCGPGRSSRLRAGYLRVRVLGSCDPSGSGGGTRPQLPAAQIIPRPPPCCRVWLGQLQGWSLVEESGDDNPRAAGAVAAAVPAWRAAAREATPGQETAPVAGAKPRSRTLRQLQGVRNLIDGAAVGSIPCLHASAVPSVVCAGRRHHTPLAPATQPVRLATGLPAGAGAPPHKRHVTLHTCTSLRGSGIFGIPLSQA